MAAPHSVFVTVDDVITTEIQAVQNAGSPITDFTEGSGARTLFEAVGIVVSQQSAAADQLNADSYLDTATGDALDALAANLLVPRKPAIQATGQVTLTRQSTVGALTVPAGWSQLVASPSVPGSQGVGVLTTEDADFADGTATVTVSAQAVLGGSQGNLAAFTALTPLAPVNTISAQSGIVVAAGGFANGVDVEGDDAFRTRIPIAVQGRALGRKVSFLAAALAVPGVLSASVLGPGDERGDMTTLTAGQIEVYYQGSAGLLSAVQSAVSNAATLGQTPTAFASVSLGGGRGQQQLYIAVAVYCAADADTTAIHDQTKATLIAFIDGLGMGATAYVASAINAMLAVPGVISVEIPLTQFSIEGGAGVADVPIPADGYANLGGVDAVVAVVTL